MAEFVQGSLAAFNSLYAKYKTSLFNFLYRLSGSKETAEELHQETFLKVANKRDTYRTDAKFSTWLYSIARNLAFDAKRRAKYRNHTSLDQPIKENGTSLVERIADEHPDPARESVSKRLQLDLEQAIASLPEDQREVFLLREYSGLRFQEIAEITGAKEGTVKSRMRYALESLQESLSRYGDYARTLI